ncbi:MAG: NAD(P)H-binding protein [Pseudomonadota bacterium]
MIDPQPPRKNVLLLGATGTIGHATAQALVSAGHALTCLVRPGQSPDIPGATIHAGDVTDPAVLTATFAEGGFDAVVSCLASRTGAPTDAWKIDHQAHMDILKTAGAAGVGQFVLLSAICVQKPDLAFQQAKLAFERALMASSLTWSIVRPTAFFKSLSGQIDRVREGKPFLLFGDGTLTACKAISDRDLATFIAICLTDADKQNAVLPIGGPGPEITPLEQGELLFELLGQPARFRHVPVAMMSAIVGVLSAAGRLSPRLAAKAELARIGRYYATESMLVWDADSGCYDPDATPEFGTDTLRDHYTRVLAGEVTIDLGDHAVF